MLNLRNESRIWNILSAAVIVAALSLLVFVGSSRAHVTYSDFAYTPGTPEETIAYLHGMIAQLLLQLQTQQHGVAPHRPYDGRVLGAQFTHRTYEVAAGTRSVEQDRDEVTFTGTVDLRNAPYAYVWFEYGDRSDDIFERTARRRVTRNGGFDADVDMDDLRRGRPAYVRAVAESPSGHRDRGFVRAFVPSGRDRDHDDEPDADTLSPRDVDEDSAELRGEVDMNDFRNGIVFFVYGEDEDQIEDVERDYHSFNDVDEDGDDLQKVRVDRDLDGRDDYRERVRGLDDGTEHFFQICVEYEDEDDDETLECGGVEDFETDRD